MGVVDGYLIKVEIDRKTGCELNKEVVRERNFPINPLMNVLVKDLQTKVTNNGGSLNEKKDV